MHVVLIGAEPEESLGLRYMASALQANKENAEDRKNRMKPSCGTKRRKP
jgi:hypothetical protein